jgi:rare lipoprotein A
VEQSPESSIVQKVEVSLPQEPKGVYVQLGAFSLRPKAESFLSQMRSEIAWLGDAIRLYARDGLYRVHAGPYADARQADQVAARIEQTIDIRPIVIVR